MLLFVILACFEERSEVFSTQPSSHISPGICYRTTTVWTHLHVQVPSVHTNEVNRKITEIIIEPNKNYNNAYTGHIPSKSTLLNVNRQPL